MVEETGFENTSHADRCESPLEAMSETARSDSQYVRRLAFEATGSLQDSEQSLHAGRPEGLLCLRQDTGGQITIDVLSISIRG